MPQTNRTIRVAVPGPLRKTFLYHLPDELGQPAPGQRILVPFGNRNLVGYYLGPGEPVVGIKTRPIKQLLDGLSYLPPSLFKLCLWIADYYFANPADCLALGLPSLIRSQSRPEYQWLTDSHRLIPDSVSHLAKSDKKLSPAQLTRIKQAGSDLLKKLLEQEVIKAVWTRELPRQATRVNGYQCLVESIPDHFSRSEKPSVFEGVRSVADLKELGWTDHYLRKGLSEELIAAVYDETDRGIMKFISGREEVGEFELTDAQQKVMDRILPSLGAGFKPFLLHGVTGSGKTLVYCHLAREVIKSGRTVLVLTPEITLSGTTLAYFRGFFSDQVTIIHSAMTDRERLESWEGIRAGKYPIVIGPRSALFAPLENLGLVIIDEEHDASYKQNDPSPRFHGRDAGVMRARLADVPVLLGSATPSLESYHNVQTGRYELVELTDRPAGAILPEVKLVDMGKEGFKGEMRFLSLPLKKEIERHLARDSQVILYLNRRGYAPFVRCRKCGEVPGCPRCNIKLTYHQSGRKYSCHYCGHTEFGPGQCSNCKSTDFDFVGAGTQKVEESLPLLLDQARVVRFDSDTASGRQQAHRILARFADREFNLLLGTQMVTKGLDLPGVTLVGVLSADFDLDLPDFRASERTFSRLVQVAGRSGRGQSPGEVMIQTNNPDLPVITDSARQNYHSFFEREIKVRHQFNYPPFSRLIRVVLSSPDGDKLGVAARRFGHQLEQKTRDNSTRVSLLGPAECPLSYLKGRHRRHLLIKTRQIQKVLRLLTAWENDEPRFGLPANVKIAVDVDPVDLF